MEGVWISSMQLSLNVGPLEIKRTQGLFPGQMLVAASEAVCADLYRCYIVVHIIVFTSDSQPEISSPGGARALIIPRSTQAPQTMPGFQ